MTSMEKTCLLLMKTGNEAKLYYATLLEPSAIVNGLCYGGYSLWE
jgi:hypothetical protein